MASRSKQRPPLADEMRRIDPPALNFTEGKCGSNAHQVRGLREFQQFRNCLQTHQVRPPAETEVGFDGHVRGAGNPARVRVFGSNRQALNLRSGPVEDCSVRFELEVLQRRGRERQAIAKNPARSASQRERRVADRPIAGAPAQISAERLGLARTCSIRAIVLGPQTHDESRSTVTALGIPPPSGGLFEFRRVPQFALRLPTCINLSRRP